MSPVRTLTLALLLFAAPLVAAPLAAPTAAAFHSCNPDGPVVDRAVCVAGDAVHDALWYVCCWDPDVVSRILWIVDTVDDALPPVLP